MTWTAKLAAWALAALLIFGAGMAAGWKLWGPKAPRQEVYAAPIRQGDGSLILEKKPQADAKPAQQVPKGAVVERLVEVTVQPDAPLASPRDSGVKASAPGDPGRPPCPPVRVDLTLIRLPDETRRVIASSPDGTVLPGASVDIPVEAAMPPPKVLKSAAGLEYAVTPWGATKSLLAQRDWGFLRLGARVGRTTLTLPTGTTLVGTEAGVSVLVRF